MTHIPVGSRRPTASGVLRLFPVFLPMVSTSTHQGATPASGRITGLRSRQKSRTNHPRRMLHPGADRAADASEVTRFLAVTSGTSSWCLPSLETRWIAGSSSGRLGLVEAYLETERLILRRFTPDDADLLIELDSDPAVMRYLTGGEATTAEEVRERLLPYILSLYERWEGNFGLFAAHAKDSGDFVGWFHLRPEQEAPREEVELGYRLRQAEWDKGYATEGGRGLVDKGLTDLDVRFVWAATMTANVASQKVMEKIGMTLAETIPTPPDMQMCEGAERGGVRYQIDREGWRAAVESGG